MNKKVSILTLSALLLNTLGVSEVFAQRQNRFRGRTGFVKKIVVPNKTIENSDFKASTGLVTNVIADTTIPGDTTTPDDTTPPGDGTNNEDNTNPEDKENGESSDIGIDTEDNVSPEAVAKLKDLLQKYNVHLATTSASCNGIKNDLETVKGLITGTIVSSGIGTLAAGGATATSIIKAVNDKKGTEASTTETDSASSADKSKVLGNVTTGLMAGATLTSGVSTVTSFTATGNINNLIEQMNKCNANVQKLKLIRAELEAEYDGDNLEGFIAANKTLTQGSDVATSCGDFDMNAMDTIKGNMIASGIVSSVGIATGAAGTTTSVLSNIDNDKLKEKKKGLNVATSILAGVTTGTSGASTVTSSVAMGKLGDNIGKAEKCEAVLNKVYVDGKSVVTYESYWLDEQKGDDTTETTTEETTSTETTTEE